jgi:hypothetical protein
MGDILWRDTSGNVAIWLMNGAQITQEIGVGNLPPLWSIAGTGDFNGDGKTDILWRHVLRGDVAIWLMNGAHVTQAAGVGNLSVFNWSIVETGDFDGDGKSDILWQHTSGQLAIWFMNGTQVAQALSSGILPVRSIQAINAD